MPDTAARFQSHVRVGVCVLLVGVAMAMVQYKIPTIMLDIMNMFSLDAAGVSWLMSIFVLMMIPLAIPAGFAVSKLGPRRIVALSVALIVFGSIIGALACNATFLLITRAIEGAGVTTLTVAGPVLIGQCVAPERNASAMGFWGMWGPLGSAFAALLTPSVYSSIGFKGLWLSYAAIVIAAAFILFAIVKKPALSDIRNVKETKIGYVAIFNRDTLLFFIGFIGFNVVMLAILSYVPVILQNKGMDATMSGFVSTLPMLLSVISSPLFGCLLDKTGKTKSLLVITVACLGPCAFLLYTQSGFLMWTAAVLMGLVGMGSSGLLIAAFVRTLSDSRLVSVGMGVFITVQGVGQLIGSAAVQALLGPNLDQVFLAGAVVMIIDLIGALCMALARYR